MKPSASQLGVPATAAVLSLRGKEVGGESESGTHVLFVAVSLMMSIIGPGLLCIPFAFRMGGLITTLIVLALVGAGASFTAELLLRSHLLTGCCSYDSLAALAFGKGSMAQRVVPWVNFFGIFGACTGYMRIVLTLLPLLGWLPFSWAPAAEKQLACTLIGAGLFLVIALPFCLLEDISKLRFVSVAGFGFSIFLIGCIVYQSLRSTIWSPVIQPSFIILDNSLSTTIALCNFAFVMHLNVIASYKGLRPNMQTRRVMIRVLRGVSLLTTFLYAVTGGIAYSMYGTMYVVHAVFTLSCTLAYISHARFLLAARRRTSWRTCLL
jgi:amino acid permease